MITIRYEDNAYVARRDGRAVAYAAPRRRANQYGALTCTGFDIYVNPGSSRHVGFVPYNRDDRTELDEALRAAALEADTG